jgi:hypothetical protein
MGLISQPPSQRCGIEKSITRLLGNSMTGLNWRKIFTSNYDQAMKYAVLCRALAETDVTTWVNAIDAFNDLLLYELFTHDSSIGTYSVGAIGGVLNTTSAFAQSYPMIFRMVQEFHKKRLESMLSHPFTRSSGKPTGYIKYTYLSRGKQILRDAFIELFSKW